MTLRRSFQFGLSAVLVAVLAACGGGGSDTAPRATVTALRVMGDSLADVGTYGFKFTIQGNDTYPERVAQSYGLDKGCNFFSFTGTTFAPNAKAGCTNYAIGNSVIHPASNGFTAADPRGLAVQLAAATAAGNFAAGDLLLVDGGGNDASALVGAYLAASKDGGASYLALLGTLLTPAQVSAAAGGGAAGLATAGSTYMVALADKFAAMLQAGALDKGAQRIALLNMPGITNTPRFQLVLDSIGAAAGATARAQSEGLFKGWTVAFNTQLAAKFAGNSKVAVVDFYTAFNDQVTSPAQFNLTNVKTPACPVTGAGTDGLPTYSFPTCTDASLAAAPPAGLTGTGWYKSYAFSDGFHPTPYGHQLLSQLIARTLAQAGWL
jgi:outer membrane lipase/esterase